MKRNLNNWSLNHNLFTKTSWQNSLGMFTLIGLLLASFTTVSFAQSWTPVPVLPVSTQIAGIQIGTTQLWARDNSGGVYQYGSGALNKVDPPGTPSFASIAVGAGPTVWALSSAKLGNIYKYDFSGKQFINVKGNFVEIASGGILKCPQTWGVNSSNQIYEWNGTSFVQPPNGEQKIKFQTAFVGSYEVGIWALDTKDNSYLYNCETHFFDWVGGGTMVEIAVGTGEVWALNATGQVFQYMEEEWVPLVGANLKHIAAGNNSNIWGIDNAGIVYKYAAGKFEQVKPQPPEPIQAAIRVSSGGLGVFVLADSGNVYKYVP